MRFHCFLVVQVAILWLSPACAFAATPHLTDIQPQEVHPGEVFKLAGSGFGNTSGRVFLNDGYLPESLWGDSQIMLHAPALAGIYAVKVCVADDCSNQMQLRIVTSAPPDPAVADVDNGIVVTGVKQYSDAVLQAMLDASRQKLMSLQLIDQAGIASRIGGLQGSTSSVSGFGVSVNGPSLPGVTTTANTGNTQTTTANGTSSQVTGGGTTTTQSSQTGNTGGVPSQASSSQLQVTGPSTTTGATGTDQTVISGPNMQTVTTQAAANPTAPSVPATSSYTLPSGFSVSASDVLNEQMQTNADIEGYTILLDGAIDDHLMVVPVGNRKQQIAKTRVTLGVPVDIRNSGKYPDAVAEVTLRVTAASTSTVLDARPGIVALLPTQKTYNVASIVDHSVSVGGGLVTSVASVGVSWLWGHHTYYIVKDQDTVAFELPADPNAPMTQSFGWQFRPTLGQRKVIEGPRQVFVQLAFPTMPAPASVVPVLGTVYVTTTWKKLDRKRNAVSPTPISGSVSTYSVPFIVQQYNLAPDVGAPDWSDNGDGTLTVLLAGSFLSGTFVQAGAKTYADGAAGFTRTPDYVQFTLPELDVATQRIRIIDRSGVGSDIVYPDTLRSDRCLAIKDATPNPISPTLTELTLNLVIKDDKDCGGMMPGPSLSTKDLVVLAGNHVFGLRDAPFASRTDASLTVLMPTDLLRANHEIVVKRLFAGSAYADKAILDFNAAMPAVSKAIVLGSNAAGTNIALIGSGLHDLSPVLPPDATIQIYNGTAAVVTIPKDELDGLKQIVLKDKTNTLLMISAPAAPDDGPSLEPLPPIKAGTSSTIRITGSGLESLDSVIYNRKPVPILAKDKKSVTLKLPPAAVAHAGTLTLQFIFKEPSKVNYGLSIFDQKVQVQSDSLTVK